MRINAILMKYITEILNYFFTRPSLSYLNLESFGTKLLHADNMNLCYVIALIMSVTTSATY